MGEDFSAMSPQERSAALGLLRADSNSRGFGRSQRWYCPVGPFICLQGARGLPHPALQDEGWGPGCDPRQRRQIRIPCVFLTPSLCKEPCGPQNTIADDSRPAHPRRIPTKGNVFWFFLYLDLTGETETLVSVTAATQLGGWATGPGSRGRPGSHTHVRLQPWGPWVSQTHPCPQPLGACSPSPRAGH